MYNFSLIKDKNDSNHAILILDDQGVPIEKIVNKNKYYYYTILLDSKFLKKDLKNCHKINLSINFNGEYALTTNLSLIDNFEPIIQKIKLDKGFVNKKKTLSSLNKIIKKYKSFIVFI